MGEVETEPRHGERGWDLLAYEWDEETGMGRFQYQRRTRDYVLDRGSPRQVTETREVERQQMVPAPKPKRIEAQPALFLTTSTIPSVVQ